MPAYLTTELRSQLPVFAVAGLVTVVLHLAAWLSSADLLVVISLLSGLVIWCSLACYASWRLFSFYIQGHDVIFHLADMSRFSNLLIRGSVSVAYLSLYAALSLPYGSTFWVNAGDESAVFIYFGVAKLVSHFSFLALAIFLVILSRWFERSMSAFAFASLVYITITAGWGVALWNATTEDSSIWTLGVTTEVTVVNQYINILPIGFIEPSSLQMSDSISYTTVAINLAVGTVFLLAGFGLAKIRDQNSNFYLR